MSLAELGRRPNIQVSLMQSPLLVVNYAMALHVLHLAPRRTHLFAVPLVISRSFGREKQDIVKAGWLH